MWRGWAFSGGPRARSWWGPRRWPGGGKAALSCGESPAWAIWVSCVKGLTGPGVPWGHRLRCQLNRGPFSSPTLWRSEKDSAECGAPHSVVYFCQNGLPALESTTKMSPFTLLGKFPFWICRTLSTPFLEGLLFFWLARVSLGVRKAGVSLPA